MKLLKKVFLIFLLAIQHSSTAQVPSIQWSKCYGGDKDDKAFGVVQTSDGGFVVAGVTFSTNGDVSGLHGAILLDDVWLIKLDSLGNLMWQKCIGGSLGEGANSIANTLDGGFILAGYASSSDFDATGSGNHNSSDDYWIVKTDSQGNIQWQKCFGGSGGDYAYNINQTIDSGFIVAGKTQSTDGDVTGNHGNDIWTIKLDASGNLKWQKSLGGWDLEIPYGILQNADSDYFVLGNTFSNDNDVSGNHGSSDFWLVQLDTTGSIINQKCYGGSGNDGASSLIEDGQGGYYIVGTSSSNDGDVSGNHGGLDIWWLHIDSMRNIISQKCIGGSDFEGAMALSPFSNNGMVVAAIAEDPTDSIFGCNDGFTDGLILALDSSGNIIWNKCLGGSAEDYLTCVKSTRDGGIIAAGYSNSNDGDVMGFHQANCSPQESCFYDFWVVKLAPLGLVVNESGSSSNTNFYFDSVGNLCVDYFSNGNQKNSITVYDIFGRIIFQKDIHGVNGFNHQRFKLESSNNNLCLVTLSLGDELITKKMMMQ